MIELEKNISILESKIYGLNFDISKSFLPDKEVVRKLLKHKNPKASKEDIDLMIDGPIDEEYEDDIIDNTDEDLETKIRNGEARRYKREEKRKKKEENKRLKDEGIYPLSEDSTQYEEARAMKREVREASMKVVKDQKLILQDTIQTSIQTGVAIPAIAAVIGSPFWNIPLAISYALDIIKSINNVVDRIMNLITSLIPLKNISFLIDESKINSILAPLNTAILILIGIFSPLSMLKSFIIKILSLLKGGNSQKKACKKIKREIRKKKREERKADSDEERADVAEEILELIKREEIICGNAIALPETDQNGDFDVSNLNFDFNSINDPNMTDENDFDESLFELLSSTKQLADKISSGEEITVYDVELPDGKVLFDLDQSALDDLKEKYKIVYKNNSV